MSSLLDTPTTPDPGHHEHAPGCAGCVDRRQVLRRAGLLTAGVAAAGVLAACARADEPADGTAPGAATPDATTPAATGGGSAALAKVADVPEGGALSVKDADGNELVLTQPTAGTIVALSAICTHQGCMVAGDGGELVCPCHGSVFDLSGANVSGPASTPLPQVDVHVVDGEVLAGKG